MRGFIILIDVLIASIDLLESLDLICFCTFSSYMTYWPILQFKLCPFLIFFAKEVSNSVEFL